MYKLIRKSKEHERAQITFFMPRDLYSWLVEKARSNGESLSSVIRGFIREEYTKETRLGESGRNLDD